MNNHFLKRKKEKKKVRGEALSILIHRSQLQSQYGGGGKPCVKETEIVKINKLDLIMLLVENFLKISRHPSVN